MSARRTIYCGEPIERLLDGRTDESGSRSVSSALNTATARYLEILRRSMPRLRLAEWGLVFDAFGAGLQDRRGHMFFDVRDAIGADMRDADEEALLARIDELTYPQKIAVIDAAERFQAARHSGGDLREAVVAIVGERHLEPG